MKEFYFEGKKEGRLKVDIFDIFQFFWVKKKLGDFFEHFIIFFYFFLIFLIFGFLGFVWIFLDFFGIFGIFLESY